MLLMLGERCLEDSVLNLLVMKLSHCLSNSKCKTVESHAAWPGVQHHGEHRLHRGQPGVKTGEYETSCSQSK